MLNVDKLHIEYLLPVCSPMLLNRAKPLNEPADLRFHTLLHDTTRDAWKELVYTSRVLSVLQCQ